MAVKLKKYQVLIIVVWYLFTLWLWSSPYHENRMPYGEFDALSHWMTADYMNVNNKPIVELPPYIGLRYSTDNSFRPNSLWYHPPYNTNFAVLNGFAGDRVLPTYIFNTVLSTAFVLILFFIMNRLFGFWAGIGSAFLATFSARDYMVYLWGQWPERIGYGLIGLGLFVFYLYADSYLNEKEERKYMYLLAILLAITMYFHPLGFFKSLGALVIFSVFLFWKERKIPFSLKTVGIGAVILIVLLAIFPLQTGSVVKQLLPGIKQEGGASLAEEKYRFDRLATLWFKEPDKNVGVPSSYFDFGLMHGWWTLPFLLIGVLFCLLLRERKHLMFLAWLLSIYFFIHLDFFGKGYFIHRSLSASAGIFIPLTLIGFYYLIQTSSQLKMKPMKYVGPVLIIIFVLFGVFVNAKIAMYGAKENGMYVTSPIIGAYSGLGRMNQEQYKAGEWMLENLPEDTNVTSVGLLDLKRARWIMGISHHINVPYAPKTENFPNRTEMYDYLMMDYSDLRKVVNQETLDVFLGWETQSRAFDELIYNEDNIRIYKVNKEVTDEVLRERVEELRKEQEEEQEGEAVED